MTSSPSERRPIGTPPYARAPAISPAPRCSTSPAAPRSFTPPIPSAGSSTSTQVHIITPATASTTTRTGWTAGGGIETKLSRNWSAKTEYLYIDTGTNSFVANPFGFPGQLRTFSHNIHVFKTGLNYNLSGPGDGISSLFSPAMLPSNHNWGGVYVGLNAGGGVSNFGASGAPDPVFMGRRFGQNDINGNRLRRRRSGRLQLHDHAKVLRRCRRRHRLPRNAAERVRLVRHHGELHHEDRSGMAPRALEPASAPARPCSMSPAVRRGCVWRTDLARSCHRVARITGDLSWTTRSGWTVGGGTEVALDAHWSAKIETLYIDTGIRTHNNPPHRHAWPAGRQAPADDPVFHRRSLLNREGAAYWIPRFRGV